MDEKELFSANNRSQLVKALGVELNCKTDDLHIYVNGKDLMEDITLDTLLITCSLPVPAVLTQAQETSVKPKT